MPKYCVQIYHEDTWDTIFYCRIVGNQFLKQSIAIIVVVVSFVVILQFLLLLLSSSPHLWLPVEPGDWCWHYLQSDFFVILTTLMVTSVDCTDCDFWLHAISTQPVCPMQQYPNTQNTLSQIPNTHSQQQIGFWKYQIHRLGSRCLQYHWQPAS